MRLIRRGDYAIVPRKEFRSARFYQRIVIAEGVVIALLLGTVIALLPKSLVLMRPGW